MRKTTLWYLGLVAILLVVASCDGGGSKRTPTGPTVNPDAPEQLNLEVRPLTAERTGTTVRYLITTALRDRNNDLVGGRAELRNMASGQTLDFTITAADLAGDCATQCTLRGVLTLVNPPPGRIDLVHTVIDAAGNRSNEISFFVTIAAAQLPREAVPGEPSIEWKPAR